MKNREHLTGKEIGLCFYEMYRFFSFMGANYDELLAASRVIEKNQGIPFHLLTKEEEKQIDMGFKTAHRLKPVIKLAIRLEKQSQFS